MGGQNVKIYGNASNVQIQQGSNNSIQSFGNHVIDDSNLELFKEIIDKIDSYNSSFETEFGEKSQDLMVALKQAKDAIDKKDDSLWKEALSAIRDIATGVTGSLIASGILGLITPLF